MRLKSLLFTLLMLACFSTAKAAHVYVGVEYGSTGDETRGYELPSFARYSVSRQIYTASEIGRSGFIKSITDEICLAIGDETDPYRASCLNVEHGIKRISEALEIDHLCHGKEPAVIGAIYHIDDGHVEFLDN